MKLMFASDIHGSSLYAEKMLLRYKEEKADKLILLGDILYHGPRNDLPLGYNPKEVAEILNKFKEEIICVRGNCEAEVDQMMLEFPVLADYIMLFVDGKTFFVTHGHKYNMDNLPPFSEGSILVNGHTHVSAIEEKEHFLYLNPGSVSIPKGNGINSYMVYENKTFILKSLENEVLTEYKMK